MNEAIKSAMDLLHSKNAEDKILGTVILGKQGKNKIISQFSIDTIDGKQRIWLHGSISVDIRYFIFKDCMLRLGGICIILMEKHQNIKEPNSDYIIENYE